MNRRVYYCDDIDSSIKFAEECIDQLDALKSANNAGFTDESGREWTLALNHLSLCSIEISIKCKKIYDQKQNKFITKQAWVYPQHQLIRGNNHEGHIIKINGLCINVNTQIL